MKTLTIRGIDDNLAEAIKKESIQKRESMNQTILKLLRKSVGLTKEPVFPEYDDLDSLAGTWTVQEEQSFYDTTKAFGEIDKEIWK